LRLQNDGQHLYLAGRFGATYDSSFVLVKLDLQGQLIYAKKIASPDNFVWYQFQIDRDGNLIFTGNSSVSAGPSNTILKLNPQGQIIHANRYSPLQIWGMSTPSQHGGVLNNAGRLIYKVNDNGAVEWIESFNGYYQSSIPPISLSDGYLVFGDYIGAINRNLVFKIDLQGNLVWSTPIIYHIEAKGAALKSNGNLLYTYTTYQAGNAQWGITEINPNGAIMNSILLPHNIGDRVYSHGIKVLPDDRVLLHGLGSFDAQGEQACMFRILPADFSELSDCLPLPDSMFLGPTQVIQDSQAISFSATPYNSFTVQNLNVNSSNVPIVINTACGISGSLSFDLGADQILCPDSIFYLKPNIPLDQLQIQWNTNETTDSIAIRGPGYYWCEISNACGSARYRDSIYIDFYPRSDLRIAFEPLVPIVGDSIRFEAINTPASIRWESPDTTIIGNPAYFIATANMSEGVQASYIDSNGCEVRRTIFPQFEDLRLHLPNAFTPNSDGLNDVFGPAPGAVYDYELHIFDRFGKQQALLYNQPWQGNNMKGGAYAYYLKYQILPGGEVSVMRGIVNLIR